MKEVLFEIVNTYLVPALATFLTGFLAWLGTKLKNKYEEKVKDETIKSIVDKCVRYVEQKYQDLDSSVKYANALQKAKEWLAEKGINVSDVELDALIESSVFELTGIKAKKEEI